jgi:uncharacterized protein (DUF433 family)
MEKRSSIEIANAYLGHRLLDGQNTSFANVNTAKAVWWININPGKFNRDLHLLLANDKRDYLVWLKIEANTIAAPDRVFQIRRDNGAIDLEISTEVSRFLVDIKGRGTGYDFTRHIVHKWQVGVASDSPDIEGTGDMQPSDETDLFEGTEVAVSELHAYLRKDWNLYGFLREFRLVSMEQALAELERDARETAKRIILCDQTVSGGQIVFERTDVPVKCMFDYLADAKTLKDFHWDFPAVSRSDAYDAVVTAGRILEIDAYRGVENGVFHSDTGTFSGAPVFVGSRMPLKTVFDYLSEGQNLKDFFYDYDTGVKQHLSPVVHLAREALEREFHEAVT